MTYLSLFSGIEAATVAWEPLGWKPVAFAEIEPFPVELLSQRYSGVPNLGDVSAVGFTLNAKGGGGRIDGESETFVAHSLRADGFDVSEDGTGRGTPLVPVANTLKANNGGGGFGSDPNGTFVPVGFRACGQDGFTPSEIAPPITSTDGGGAGIPSIAYNLRGRDGGSMPEPTDVASIRAASGGSSRTYVGVRRLTPTECERLQGFPDGYTAIPFRGKPAADGPRYKALGNSMAVPVMRWIGERIMAAERGETRCLR